MITQKRLKELLEYDEEKGVFIYKTKRGSRQKGSIAGSFQNKGYIQITVDNENYLAHRLAWLYVYGKWPKHQIDHINRIKTDNRIVNLRDVNNSTNHHNVGIRKHNTSGVTGVYWSNNKNKWVASIEINNKKYHLGIFNTLEDAKNCRYEKEKQLAI